MAQFATAILYDTLANLPSDNTVLTAGRLFFASDIVGLVYRDNGATWDQLTVRHKYDATAAPTINDDSADGYAVGSVWINLTTDKVYVCTDASAGTAQWEDLTDTSGAGSGNVTTAATYASLTAGADGDVAYPTDSFYILRSDGAALVPWGPIFPMTPPVDGDFAWVNQGSASVNTAKGGITISDPGGASNNLRIRKKAAPATPYTITAAIMPLVYQSATVRLGLVFRQASDGKLISFGPTIAASGAPFVDVLKWTNPTTFSASYAGIAWDGAMAGVRFLRIADNGTNRICSISYDGQTFTPIHSVGRTDFLTADEVGFYVSIENSVVGGMNLLSWEES